MSFILFPLNKSVCGVDIMGGGWLNQACGDLSIGCIKLGVMGSEICTLSLHIIHLI